MTPNPSTTRITSHQNDNLINSQKPHTTNYPADDVLKGTKRVSDCLITSHIHTQQNLTIALKSTQVTYLSTTANKIIP